MIERRKPTPDQLEYRPNDTVFTTVTESGPTLYAQICADVTLDYPEEAPAVYCALLFDADHPLGHLGWIEAWRIQGKLTTLAWENAMKARWPVMAPRATFIAPWM